MQAATVHWRSRIVDVVAVVTSAYMLYATVYGPYKTTIVHLALFAASMLFIYFLEPKAERPGARWRLAGDHLAAVAAVAAFGYIAFNFEHIIALWGASYMTSLDVAMGGLLIGVSLVAAKRQSLGLFALGVMSILYMLLGPYVPGAFSHSGMSIDRVIYLVAFTNEGLFGSGLDIAASYLFMLMLLSSAFNVTRTGEVISKVSTGLVGRQVGGAAKASMLASAGLGTVVGSSIGNVVSTGIFTIPLMIRTGFRRHVAAAVETNASEGAQLVPPVLGATAFIMANLTAIPYATIALAAILPALLYYLSLFVVIHIEGLKSRAGTLEESEVPSIREALKDGGHLLLAPALLFYLIAGVGFTPAFSSMICIFFALGVGLLRKSSRFGLERLLREVVNSVKQAASITALIASIGLIQAALMTTGLGPRMTDIIMGISDGSLLITSVLALIASIFLGLGLPTPIAYLLLAIIAAPALVEAGASVLAAHMFLFYFAIKSGSTPPIALVATVAAGIAKANWLETANTAFVQSLPGFIVAFMFLYSPVLLLDGQVVPTMVGALTAMVGVSIISCATQGWCVYWLNYIQRCVLFGAGVLFVVPDYKLAIAGVFIFAVVVTWGHLQPGVSREIQRRHVHDEVETPEKERLI